MQKKIFFFAAFFLFTVTSVALAGRPFAVRVVQDAVGGRQVEVLRGAERGREILHYGQTIDCSDHLMIGQELEKSLARSVSMQEDARVPVAVQSAEQREALQRAHVLQQAMADIAAGRLEHNGQCRSFAYKYGIVDLTGSGDGFHLYVETPHGSFVGRMPQHPEKPGISAVVMQEADYYKKGIGGVFGHDEMGYGLGDIRNREFDGSGFENMHAGL